MKKRRWSRAAAVIVLAAACLARSAAAQVEVVRAVPYDGVAPLGIAADGSGRVYVPDLYAGIAYRFDASLNLLGTIPGPAPSHVVTGIAWNPLNDHLYWADVTASSLHETTLEGVLVESHPLPTPQPGGAVAGMAFDAKAGTLWCLDSLNDEVFELTPEGILTAAQPIPMPTGDGSYGLGIAWLPDADRAPLEVLCGSAEEGRVARLVRMDKEGALPCSARDVSSLGDFLGGIVPKPGSSGSFYLVDNGGLAILEVRALGSPALCAPAGISCSAGSSGAEVRWEPGGFAAVEVFRDRALLATLDGAATSFFDADAPAGAPLLYEVVGVSGEARSYPAACEALVPDVTPPALPISDSFGHVLLPAPGLAFEDISSTGTRLAFPDEDDGAVAVPIGFSFPFYGASFDSAQVGTNGLLVLGGAAAEPSNTTIPSSRVPDGLIAPFWDDLDASGPDAGIFAQVRGAEPWRTFTVQWSRLQFFPADADEPNGDLSFQVVLREGTGEIDLLWGMLRGPDPELCGGSATVGIEGPGGADGILAGYNRCAVAEDSAARILPPGMGEGGFIRGDANADGSLDISDPVAILFYAFLGTANVPCLEAADAEDDDDVDLTDAIGVLSHLFLGGPPPRPPFGAGMDPSSCGPDPTPPAGPPLGCRSYPPCGTGR